MVNIGEAIEYLRELQEIAESKKKLDEGIKKGSVVIPYGWTTSGEFIVDRVFKNRDGETSYTGKFKKNGKKAESFLKFLKNFWSMR